MSKENICIVGGGVIGLCSAWYLNKLGCQLTIIDRGDFTDGTSYGNAGMICPSHFVPMAAPGVIRKGLKWLTDSRSPFYVRPRLEPDFLRWMLRFYISSRQTNARRAMPALLELNERSRDLYRIMANELQSDVGFDQRGLLMLYKTIKQEKEEIELAALAGELGVKAQIMNADELKSLEPELELDVLGGLYFPGDAHLNPVQLMRMLHRQLEKAGVRFIANTEITDFEFKNSVVAAVKDFKGERYTADQFLIAGGAWSALLLKKAGLNLLVQDGKGYSSLISGPAAFPQIPTILSEAKVAITPMGQDLRVTGTLELSGLKAGLNKSRIEGIFKSLPRYYPGLKIGIPEDKKIWTGYRPCTPDGLPYIGQNEKISNLFVGTGHGMLGLSAAAGTGESLSRIMTGQKPAMDLNVFRINRF